MSVLEQQGFQIVQSALDPPTISFLIRAIEASTIARSRAGMRLAMQIEEVQQTDIFASYQPPTNSASFRMTQFII